MKKYLIVIEETSTGYSAYSPGLPGCVSTGLTREEIERNMREAFEFHLEGMRLEGLEVPVPRTYSPISKSLRSMNEQQAQKQLREEGFGHVFTWEDRPNAYYPDHTHGGTTAHIVVSSEMTVTSEGTTRTYRVGDRLTCPPARSIPHAWVRLGAATLWENGRGTACCTLFPGIPSPVRQALTRISHRRPPE